MPTTVSFTKVGMAACWWRIEDPALRRLAMQGTTRTFGEESEVDPYRLDELQGVHAPMLLGLFAFCTFLTISPMDMSPSGLAATISYNTSVRHACSDCWTKVSLRAAKFRPYSRSAADVIDGGEVSCSFFHFVLLLGINGDLQT
jgi:hypothetical protein